MAHEKYQSVIDSLHECMIACNHCYDACLKEEDIKMMAECIRLDRECADICAYFEQAIGRGTPFISQFAELCATICEACGNECKNIITNIARSALSLVLNVQKLVENSLLKFPYKKGGHFLQDTLPF